MPPSIDDTARPAGSVAERHGSASFVTVSNSSARTCRRRCKARLGPPWARCCSLSASPLMIRSRLSPRGGPV